MMKKILALMLALAMCLTFTACGDEETVVEIEMPVEEEAAPAEAEVSSDGSWAVYWYLCGSDLESRGGFATYDLMEMTQVKLPKNVTVVIQTGGSSYWHNNTVSSKNLQLRCGGNGQAISHF